MPELSSELPPSLSPSLFLPAERLFFSDLLRTLDGQPRLDRHFRTLKGRLDYNALVSIPNGSYRLEFRVPASRTRAIGSRVLRHQYVPADAALEFLPGSF